MADIQEASMQQYTPMRDTGSTRGFTTVDPERQGVLVGMMRPIQSAQAPGAKPAMFPAGTGLRATAARLSRDIPGPSLRAR
jgi:hypothetical protein